VDDAELALARALLARGPALLSLSPAARVAWQEEQAGIMVFCNGDAALFSASVLDCLTALCGNGQLQGAALAGAIAGAETARLLDYLLETGGIDVE
jgi:50S ribosomal protein L16 3-hydroxylase